jgi:RNA polymerase sigma factor (sigma-70 family)
MITVEASGAANGGWEMPTSQLSEVIQHLRRTVLLRDEAGLTDGQLLESFISRREDAGVAALVRRHGPMVWGVCRRVLRNYHDVEDAFQATFLVLVRRAASVVPRAMVANWLHGVAYQTALKAKATAAKRRARERQVVDMPEAEVVERDRWHDLEPLLDQELSRLADKYREVVLLCDLEGKTRKEAARQLGAPEGTVAGRLARARAMLAKRLARHGLAVSGGALAGVLSQSAASAYVPTSVVSSTIKAASLITADQAAAAGVVSPTASALTEEVLRAMFWTKLKAARGVCLAISLIVMLGSALGYRALAADKEPTNKEQGKLRDTLLVLDKQFWEASSKHDVGTLNKLIADDYLGIGSGTRWTKKAILQQHREFRTGDLKLVTDREVIRLTEHAALLTYEAKFKVFTKSGAPFDTAHQRMISCWVQRDGRWFVVFSQVTDVVGPAAQTKAEGASTAAKGKGKGRKQKALTPDDAVEQAKRIPKKPVTVEFGVGSVGTPIIISVLRDGITKSDASFPLMLEWDGVLKQGGRFYVLLKGRALEHAMRSDLAKHIQGKGVRVTGTIRPEHETTSELLWTNYYIIVDDPDQFEVLK